MFLFTLVMCTNIFIYQLQIHRCPPRCGRKIQGRVARHVHAQDAAIDGH